MKDFRGVAKRGTEGGRDEGRNEKGNEGETEEEWGLMAMPLALFGPHASCYEDYFCFIAKEHF